MTDDDERPGAMRPDEIARQNVCACPWNNGYHRDEMAAHQHHHDCTLFVDHDDLAPFDDD